MTEIQKREDVLAAFVPDFGREQSEVTPVNGRSATGTELVDMKAFLSSNDLMRFV